MAKKIRISEKNSGKYDTPYTENIYDGKDDIYNNAKEEKFIDEDGPFNKNVADIEDSPAHDLNIPGTELDNDMENIGEEDEENNYYSLGGDNHENLD